MADAGGEIPRYNTEAGLSLALQHSSSEQRLIYFIEETQAGVETLRADI